MMCCLAEGHKEQIMPSKNSRPQFVVFSIDAAKDAGMFAVERLKAAFAKK